MRRSFGPRMGGGGGGGNGGGMIKTVHRAVRAGLGGGGGSSSEPYSQFSSTRSTTSTNRSNMNQPLNTSLFLSNNCNTTTSSPYVPVTGPPHWDILTPPASGGDHELFDWEYVDELGGCGSDGESVYGFYDDIVYGSVPSKDEVHHAVSSLQEVLESVSFGQFTKDRRTHGSDDDGVERISSQTSFCTSESDWIEPSMHSLQVPSVGKVYDAFHLLQTEPSVQRMVMSLSSDKAVWDAVMNNEVVRELRESVGEADKSISDGSEDGDSNPVTQVLRWIFVNTKDKVIEIVEKLTKIVNELIQPMNKDETSKRDDNAGLNAFEENLRSSFFLSMMVLLIVVVTRAHKC